MKSQKLTSPEDVRSFAKRVIGELQGRAGSVVLALHGELGAGKTTFVRALARELGVVESTVTSPTFVIMKRHELVESAPFKNLIHIDAYRIESPDELRPLRFSELLEEEGNLIAIEWAERVADILPEDRLEITFAHTGVEDEREVSYHQHNDSEKDEQENNQENE